LKVSHWPLCLTLWRLSSALTCLSSGLIFGTLINHSFNFECHTTIVRGTAIYPGVVQCCNCWHWGYPTHACHTQGTKCQKCGSLYRVENHRLLAWCYKANSKSNLPREATAASILCPHTFKCLNCKSATLLMITSVPSGATTLISSGMLIRLLRCTLDKLTTALSTALVGVVFEYV